MCFLRVAKRNEVRSHRFFLVNLYIENRVVFTIIVSYNPDLTALFEFWKHWWLSFGLFYVQAQRRNWCDINRVSWCRCVGEDVGILNLNLFLHSLVGMYVCLLYGLVCRIIYVCVIEDPGWDWIIHRRKQLQRKDSSDAQWLFLSLVCFMFFFLPFRLISNLMHSLSFILSIWLKIFQVWLSYVRTLISKMIFQYDSRHF